MNQPDAVFAPSSHCGNAARALTSWSAAQNNCSMTRPEAVRRVKSYSAATGYVYQYYFLRGAEDSPRLFVRNRVRLHGFGRPQKGLPVAHFCARGRLVEKWSRAAGRPLSGTEEYAAAKMRLFQAFDEVEDLESRQPTRHRRFQPRGSASPTRSIGIFSGNRFHST